MGFNGRMSIKAVSILMLFSSSLYAADAAPSQNAFGSFVPLIVIFVIFYFLLIRPQQKKSKEHQQMLDAVKKDDKVVTSGGIHGVVASVKGDIVELKIAENVKVQVSKSAIATIVAQQQGANEAVTPEIVK